jgi:hypothetical protein
VSAIAKHSNQAARCGVHVDLTARLNGALVSLCAGPPKVRWLSGRSAWQLIAANASPPSVSCFADPNGGPTLVKWQRVAEDDPGNADEAGATAEAGSEGFVARIPVGDGDSKSAVLVARSLGYLIVRVLFHGRPVSGLTVDFGQLSDIKDQSPAMLKPTRATDDDGIAVFPRLMPTGSYACRIEKQPDAVVHTTASLDDPFVVVLPVGRPFVDVADVDEFSLLDLTGS